MSTRSHYEQPMMVAARQVLLELASMLEDELDYIVFVGGTECGLLFPQETDPHEGTIDVDMVLDPIALAEYGDQTLEERLMANLYQQEVGKNYRWVQSVLIAGERIQVKVDLLSGEYDDFSKHKQSREVQGLHASVLRGLDLAFLHPQWVPISGVLPTGNTYQTRIQICNPASLLAMKGIAIGTRLHGADKDAYDIDYIIRRTAGGIDSLAQILGTVYYRENGLVQEGLQGIAKAFHSIDAFGPTSVASPDRYPEPEARAIIQQGAFLRVQHLLQELAS